MSSDRLQSGTWSIPFDHAALLLSAIVDSSDDAIISKDLNGIVTSWNQSAERLFGYTALEMVGKPIWILIPPDRLDEEPVILEKLKRGERVDHFETLRRCKDGRLIELSLTISPVRNAQGIVVGASKIARDITQRKAVENNLQKTTEELEQFVYAATHDVKEPLRTIAVFAQLAQKKLQDQMDDQTREYLSTIQKSAQRLSHLIESLLQFTSIRNDQTSDMKPSVVDTEQSLNDALKDLQVALDESHGTVFHDPLPCVAATRIHVCELFQNLIGNALKYRRPDISPVVNISATRDGALWTFAVKDNGIGIPSEAARQVFEPFKRLHGPEISGAGIGLAICKRIVERYGGTMDLASEEGVGSTFYFSLPAEGSGGHRRT